MFGKDWINSFEEDINAPLTIKEVYVIKVT